MTNKTAKTEVTQPAAPVQSKKQFITDPKSLSTLALKLGFARESRRSGSGSVTY